MRLPRILIGAPASGSGKTLLTCGLLELFAEDHKRITAFKCGPDYIDPMFHQTVLGVPSGNLDTFFTGERLTKNLMAEAAQGMELAVAEGVMGLYDGLGGIREEGSSYHLAKVTGTPVLLVIDAHGMGRSLLPLISGFLAFDKEKLIRGVLLNKTSKMFYEVIKPEIERHCRIPVLGYFPKQEELRLESRHLGLVMPGETAGIKDQIKKAAKILRETADIRQLLSVAESACELEPEPVFTRTVGERIRIGVAMDEAFCFYYRDNLKLLEKAGAKLIPFSPLRDETLPEGICGLLLGGGYPELYAHRLSENDILRRQVKKAVQGGMPTIAECGGFLYLHEKIKDMEKREFPMAGVVRGTCYDTGKPVRFGYLELKEKETSFLPERETIRGHEFHYFDSTSNGSDCLAAKPATGKTYECVHAGKTAWMGFAHLFYYSNPEYVYRFLEKAVGYGKRT